MKVTPTPTSGAADLLDLIEAYAEARHSHGHSSYNAKTAAALQAVKAALAAGQATAAQAAPHRPHPAVLLPDLFHVDGKIWSAILDWRDAKRGEDALRKASELERVLVDQLRAFADATHTLRASRGQAPAKPDPAYSAACHLATALFKKHFAHLPDFASGQAVWGLCDSTAGVISQIDNMVSGLVQPPTTSPQADNKKKDPL